jgi:NSS family neurotransmitter:Na+ symporter
MARESWASRFGFIMATAGFAIGLGNVWRFPYLTGESGGGAFVLVYLVLALLIGIPLFVAEISLGRKAQLTPIAGMQVLTGKKLGPWNLIGWFGVIAAFLIQTYYFVLIGWVIAYMIKTLRGEFRSGSPEQISQAYTTFVGSSGEVLIYSAIAVVLTGLVVARGVQKGVETAAKYLMPVLFIMLMVLAIGALLQPGATAGLRWYLAPDFTKIDLSVVLVALGQVFFSIGVGMAGAFAFGSYLSPRASDVPGSAVTVVAFDTGAAFLAGLVMFPALFAFGLEPNQGPGLLFVTMSNLFARAPAGQIVGTIFYFLVLIAGLTSAIAVIETLTASLMDSWGMARKKALWPLLAVLYICGIPSVLSFGSWSEMTILGRNAFELVDYVSGNVLLTLGGLLLSIYTAYVWGFDMFQEETNTGVTGRIRVFDSWRPFIVFVIPIALAVLALTSIGILR